LENLKVHEKNPRYKFVKGDIGDVKVAGALVADSDIIVNFAAETHVDRSITGPALFIETNIVGTQVLLDSAVKHKKRFHHVSTDEVFGDLPLGTSEKFNENSVYNPSSPYSASKAGSDYLVRAYHRTYGLPITISNCSNNYGPYAFIEKFIPLMITNAQSDKKLPVYGDGKHVRDWIHVKDHCSAIDLVIEKGKIGETYLAGGNAERSNIEVVKEILKQLGKSEDLIEFVKDRPGHDRRYAIDSTKIEKELGWKRHYNFEDGLTQTIKWYEDNKKWWGKLISKEYLNYYKELYENR
jgi:dTDP-glucose 4,6-dehydratase